MKPAFLMLALACGMALARADVATSADYEMTLISLDGGGLRSSSAVYTNDLVLSAIVGRNLATASVSNVVGYVAQLNNAPIAGDDLQAHPLNQPLDIRGAVLLGNDFDLDGDILRVAAVDGTTSAGGTVVNSRGVFQYTAPVGYNGIDHFNYSIFDENGDVDFATVTMVVAPVGSQATNSIALYRLSDGSLLLRAQLKAGLNEYYLESTDALELDEFGRPIWETQQIFKSGADGLIQVIVHPADERKRFYHAWAL